MAYDKHTWTCGDVITAEKLNHIEDGIASASSGGFECEETWVAVTEETVTTVAEEGENGAFLSYSQLIDADTIKVTFNGTEYECQRIDIYDAHAYGGITLSGFDFSEYPFVVASQDEGNMLITETVGTYTIKIEVEDEVVTTTSCFDKARGYSCTEEWATLTEESVETTSVGDFAEGELSYSQPISANVIKVTLNGVEYECPGMEAHDAFAYGGLVQDVPDFSEYPFLIVSSSNDGYTSNFIYTQIASIYTVKIEAMEGSITTTPCFDLARGYSCTRDNTTLTEESVTATLEYNIPMGTLSLMSPINAHTIKVIFDGTEYECDRMTNAIDDYEYGAPYDSSLGTYDWSEYPFSLHSDIGNTYPNELYVETAGTYTIKIVNIEEVVSTTSCFEQAVKSVVGSEEAESVQVPVVAYMPVLKYLSLSQAVTIQPNSGGVLAFSSADELSQYAVIRRMNLTAGLLINDYAIGDYLVDIYVYNVTNSAITETDAQLSVVDFTEVSNLRCVLVGKNCPEK